MSNVGASPAKLDHYDDKRSPMNRKLDDSMMDEENIKSSMVRPTSKIVLVIKKVEDDDMNRVYCVCKQGWGGLVDEKMIGCDGCCNEWYHPSCILMTKHEQNMIETNNDNVWVCDSCLVRFFL